MLHSISWQTYFAAMGIMLCIYWLFVGLAYFTREIVSFLKGRRETPSPAYAISNPFEASPDTYPGNGWVPGNGTTFAPGEDGGAGIELFPVAYAMADDIKLLLKDAGRRRMIREELVQALQSLVRKEPYPLLRGTGFTHAINNLVSVEAENECSVHFDVTELNVLWL